MAISHAGSLGTSGGGSTSVVVDLPGSLAADDVAYVFIGTFDSVDVTAAPSGAVLGDNTANAAGGANMRLVAYAVPLAGSETDLTFTYSGTAAFAAGVTVLRGCDTADPWAGVLAEADDTQDSDLEHNAGITPDADNCWLLFGAVKDTTDSATIAPPSGMTERVEEMRLTTFVTYLASEVLGAAAATGARTTSDTTGGNGRAVVTLGAAKPEAGEAVSVSGTITPSGSLILNVVKELSGDVSFSGTDRDVTPGVVLEGTTSPTGLLDVHGGPLDLAGSTTPAGDLALLVARSFSGQVALAGDMARTVQLQMAGAATMSGSLVRQVQTDLVGSVTLSGTVAAGRLRDITVTLPGPATVSWHTAGGADTGWRADYTAKVG